MGDRVDKVNQSSDEILLELVHQVAFRIKSSSHEAIAEAGISHMEARTLRFFAHHRNATASDLVRHTGRDKGQVARLITELVDRGFLARGEGTDRRSHTLNLTAEGRSIFRHVHQRNISVASAMFASLDENEREQLADLLRRIVD